MFNCNSLGLLTFTYYLKLLIALSMTIIPFILTELMVIRLIKNRNNLSKINIKKELKTFFYILVIFTLSFSLHNILNNKDNKCYMYANKEILTEYKANYEALNNTNLSKELKEKYLNKVLTTAYFNYNNKDKIINVSSLKNNLSETKTAKTPKTEDNILKETDSRKLNKVYVLNGTFYYPKFIYGNKATYTGMNCPSNPLKEGYNNPYGYNNYFYIRLTNFIEDAKQNGYKITISNQGCRTYQTQVNYYQTMTKGRAAAPGYSLHGLGIASDLEFYKNDGSVCPYGRTDTSCPSMGWAHQNAYKYGLTFPLLNASYKEDWHIEPISKVTY